MPQLRGDEPWLDDVFTPTGRQKIVDHIIKKIEAYGMYEQAAQRKERAIQVEEEALFSTRGPVEYLKKLARSITKLEEEANAQNSIDPAVIPDVTPTVATPHLTSPSASAIERRDGTSRPQILVHLAAVEDTDGPAVRRRNISSAAQGHGSGTELPVTTFHGKIRSHEIAPDEIRTAGSFPNAASSYVQQDSGNADPGNGNSRQSVRNRVRSRSLASALSFQRRPAIMKRSIAEVVKDSPCPTNPKRSKASAPGPSRGPQDLKAAHRADGRPPHETHLERTDIVTRPAQSIHNRFVYRFPDLSASNNSLAAALATGNNSQRPTKSSEGDENGKQTGLRESVAPASSKAAAEPELTRASSQSHLGLNASIRADANASIAARRTGSNSGAAAEAYNSRNPNVGQRAHTPFIQAILMECHVAASRYKLVNISTAMSPEKQLMVIIGYHSASIALPKMILRPQASYLATGSLHCSFAPPPTGWIGILREIQQRFYQCFEKQSRGSVRITKIIDLWIDAVTAVVRSNIPRPSLPRPAVPLGPTPRQPRLRQPQIAQPRLNQPQLRQQQPVQEQTGQLQDHRRAGEVSLSEEVTEAPQREAAEGHLQNLRF